MPTTVTTITDDQFATEVLEADSPVVVDFWAAWCPPCRVMDPVMAELADERPGVRFVKLDVDANQKTASEYGVLSMPTLLVFRHGQEVLRLVGARPKRRLIEELAPAMGSPIADPAGAV
ncbi:MAG TPA: thioredoxin [Solirubrobacteraceae bacterium]|nr:thioredoxin [Solirubrobacteraceae bacterium]